MKRKEFIQNMYRGSLVGLLGFGNSWKAKAKSTDQGTPILNQVGFNHIKKMETKTATTVLHKAETRGDANHGWLQSKHSFSFANYYDPERMNFGVLRVLNDDTVAAGMGFGKHPHSDMEIISIPLEGDLKHMDSTGRSEIIRQGDVQVMSAGRGIQHSEMNANRNRQVKFLQIWVMPKKRGVEPRYQQITLEEGARHNKLQQILSPNAEDAGVWIHQDAWFHLGNLDSGTEVGYSLKKAGNGIYAFVIEGDVTINGQSLNKRDGYGLWDIESLDIKADSSAELLLMEVPMRVHH